MRRLSSVVGVLAILLVAGEVLAGGKSLGSLKAQMQERKETLERRKAEIEKRAAETDKCIALTRIPEILEGFRESVCSEKLTSTSQYLSEFTSRYLTTKLSKRSHQNTEEQQGNCSVCLDEVDSGDDSVLMKCGERFHLRCVHDVLRSYLEREKPELLTSCPARECCDKLSPEELASIVSDSDQALGIQRMLVRSVDELKFCPSCGEGIAKHNGFLEFGYHCQTCDRDLCFSCGRPPHHEVTCEELNTDRGVRNAFIREILKSGQSES